LREVEELKEKIREDRALGYMTMFLKRKKRRHAGGWKSALLADEASMHVAKR
jgi:hypothetical protein